MLVLQSFHHPKLYAYPYYLNLKTKQVTCCRQQFPSSVITQSMIGKLHEYMGTQVHNLNKSLELNIAQLCSKRTFLPQETKDPQRA